MTLLVTLALSFLVVVLAVAGMSIGVIAGRAPIKGSCGGVGSGGCELCSGNCHQRKDASAGRPAGEMD